MKHTMISDAVREKAIVMAPASKSISHRYLLGAALAKGISTVHHTLESLDLECTRTVLSSAGACMEPLAESSPESGAWRITGMDGKLRGGTELTPLSCDVGESGTTCRLLTAVLAAGEGVFRIHGKGRMHDRPIGDLLDALSDLGTTTTCEGKPGCPPLLLHARGLNPSRCNGEVTIGMDISSQYFSGLLLAAPLACSPLTLVLGGTRAVSWPYVGLTLQCLTDFGIGFDIDIRPHQEALWKTLTPGAWRQLKDASPGCLRVRLRPSTYQAGNYTVEGDWSGASYLLAAGALGQRPVSVRGLQPDSLQGDRAILDILQKMGANVDVQADTITVYPSTLHGVALDMGACPDLVPTVAVLAAYAHGSTHINNVAHLRYKESDRIEAPATELAKAGVTVSRLDDGLLINGLAGHGNGKSDHPILPDDVDLCTHNDHRIAMSLALLDLRQPGLSVRERLDNAAVVGKSFPHFWKVWEQLT